MAESASSARQLQVLIVGGGSAGSSVAAQLLRGSARPGSGHPGARSRPRVTSPADPLELVCWRSSRRQPFRGRSRDPGWAVWIPGQRRKVLKARARRVITAAGEALKLRRPGGGHGSPAQLESDPKGCRRHSQLTAIISNYSRAHQSRTPGREIRSFKGGTACFQPPCHPNQNAAVLRRR